MERENWGLDTNLFNEHSPHFHPSWKTLLLLCTCSAVTDSVSLFVADIAPPPPFRMDTFLTQPP